MKVTLIVCLNLTNIESCQPSKMSPPVARKMARRLDIILFGATGFTGRRVLPTLYKFTKSTPLTFGVAGRSEQKLKTVLQSTIPETSLREIPIITADTDNEKSLREMARQARIVINCSGPYRFHGEHVVKACVEEGTHHVDVSGEPQYMEEIQLKYHEKARDKNVYVISSCGFDSLPTDLGVAFLQKKFPGTLNSVVTYLDSWVDGEGVSGPNVTYTTWEALVHGLTHAGELAELRRKLFKTKLPQFKPKLKTKTVHRSKLVEGWAVPFPGADRSVVTRSQRYFYEIDRKRPVQIETYFIMKSLRNVISMATFGGMVQFMVKSETGRKLLLKYPEAVSNGLFSYQEPPQEKLERTLFEVTLYGEGWKKKLPDPSAEYEVPPDSAICARVTGRNPAYGATCTCVVLAAITVLNEMEKLPPGGGVYPPGFAFAETSLVDKLTENGVKFEVAFQKDLLASKY